MKRMICLAALVWLSGCGPSLYAITPPPPTRTARMTSEQPIFGKRKHFARLSTGVAMAFNCVSGNPCRDAVATSDDPSIATVVPAHLNQLERNAISMDGVRSATFVIVGMKPGKTTIRVKSANGDTKIALTVID